METYSKVLTLSATATPGTDIKYNHNHIVNISNDNIHFFYVFNYSILLFEYQI
jgi:hypothetical protein